MESEGDLLKALLADHSIGGGRQVLASSLLLLNPEELKNCRQVNKEWNKLIKKEVWGRPRWRKELEKKLVNRWNTQNPDTMVLGQAREKVARIFCNDRHIF